MNDNYMAFLDNLLKFCIFFCPDANWDRSWFVFQIKESKWSAIFFPFCDPKIGNYTINGPFSWYCIWNVWISKQFMLRIKIHRMSSNIDSKKILFIFHSLILIFPDVFNCDAVEIFFSRSKGIFRIYNPLHQSIWWCHFIKNHFSKNILLFFKEFIFCYTFLQDIKCSLRIRYELLFLSDRFRCSDHFRNCIFHCQPVPAKTIKSTCIDEIFHFCFIDRCSFVKIL